MIIRVARQEPIPQSYAQQRLWFMHQLETATAEYNIPLAWRVRGSLDVAALRRAINGVVDRHESLRTRFDDSHKGPVQIVTAHLEVDLPLCDLSLLDEPARQRSVVEELRCAWEEPFDLRRGPLIRAKVLKLGEDDHIVVHTTHHMVTDGWSEAIFNRELAFLYDAIVKGSDETLPPLEVQYADYTVWQRDAVESGVLQPGVQYWRHQLADLADPLRLPSRRSRRNQWEAGGMHRAVVDEALLGDTRRLARTEGVTLATLWLAAFQVLLARWTGELDIPVGVVVANRERSQLRGLMGFFVNFVVVRADLQGRPPFRAFLRQVAERCYDAYSHQDVPLEKLVEVLNPARSLAWNPLFQVVFNMLNFPRVDPELPGLHVEEIQVTRDVRSTFDLKVDISAEDEALISVSYNSHLFEPADITALFDEFDSLLREVVRDPDMVVGVGRDDISGLTAAIPVEPQASPERPTVPAQGVDASVARPEYERVLCELFAEVLDVGQVGPEDDFFALGGHSLLAMILRNRIRSTLRVDLPVRAVFEAPTARGLSSKLYA